VSLRRLWLFLAVALPVLAALLATLSSVDLASNLRAGDEILRSGAVPRVDTWTFTGEGLPWFDQQWGAQLVLEAVYRLGGWTGLAVLRAALVGVIFGCVLLIGLGRGLSPRNAALLTIVVFAVAAPALALRPQLLGMALFAITLVLVSDRSRHRARLWAIPVLVVVWANVHGSFFLAPLVLGLAWVEDLSEHVSGRHTALVVAMVSVIAACLTPYGPAVWVYAAGLATNPEVTRRITEWQPTTIRDGTGLLFFLSAAAVVALIARRGRPVSWPTLAWFGAFFAIGLYAQRGLAWWPLAAALPVAALLPTTAGSPEPSTPPVMRRLNAIVVGVLLLAGVLLLPVWRPTDHATGVPAAVLTDAPLGLTAALRAVVQPGDHVFNPQPWGSWFEFAVPNAKVALDSRIEFFPAHVWDDYEAVMAGGAGWEDRLASWDVAAVVVDDSAGDFAGRLEAAGWERSYVDWDGAIFRRVP
jgi:hypothetical protein